MYTGLTDSLWRGAERKELTLTLNGAAVTGELLSLTITGSVNGEQPLLTVGNTCARMAQMQFSGAQSGFLEGKLVFSAQAGAETLPMGTFWVTEAVTRGGQTTVTAVDAMGVALAELYQPSLSGAAATAWAVLCDVVDKAELTLSARASGYESVLSGVSMASLTAGHTGRTVVGWIAGLCGCNAVMDRTGKLDFCWYSASGVTLHQQDCYEGMDQIQESDSTLAMLSVSVVDADGNTRVLSPTSAQGAGALMENPFMTQARLDGVWSVVGGMTYRPAELSFLGDLRLDAGDLITLTLEDGTICSVPAMTLSHTYDGGVTTHVTALGQGENAVAGVRNEGVLGGKLRSLSAEVAQLGALTVEDANGVTKINGGRIDTDSLFAQDITATGTITGAQLIGAALSGNAIDIQAVVDATSILIKTGFDATRLAPYLLLRTQSGTARSDISLMQGVLSLLGQSELLLSTQELVVNANTITDSNYSATSYTSFSGGVISSGTINVVKYLGWCQVFGEFKLSATVGNWTEVLTAAQVPAPKHGINAYVPSTTWGTSFVRAPRIQVNGDGGLRVRYGAAATYNFSVAYPIG